MNAIIRILLSPYTIFGPRRAEVGSRRVRVWLTRTAQPATTRALVVCKNSLGVTHNLLLRRTGNMPKDTSGSVSGTVSFAESVVQSVIRPLSGSGGLHNLFYSLPEAPIYSNQITESSQNQSAD